MLRKYIQVYTIQQHVSPLCLVVSGQIAWEIVLLVKQQLPIAQGFRIKVGLFTETIEKLLSQFYT